MKCSFKINQADGTISKYELRLPKGYINERVLKGGHGEEHQYWYADSAVVYISWDKMSATLNESDINQRPELESQRLKALSEGTSVELTGYTDDKYWKEIIFNDGTKIGYSGVSISGKSSFDKFAESVCSQSK